MLIQGRFNILEDGRAFDFKVPAFGVDIVIHSEDLERAFWNLDSFIKDEHILDFDFVDVDVKRGTFLMKFKDSEWAIRNILEAHGRRSWDFEDIESDTKRLDYLTSLLEKVTKKRLVIAFEHISEKKHWEIEDKISHP